MPICIVIRENLSCTVVFCDHCRREIKTAKDGNFEWRYDATGPSDVFFTHKACSTKFRDVHPEIEMSEELTVFPLFLGNNLEINPKDAQRSAELGDSI